ncbi:Zn(II)2Cys6 transcription factor [Aspergillus flavus]|uniref:Zn(II)2Cys6 transcription factor n=1 Tax=Aspergillus flavus (strain ATCC 200026 / FGSC A1120 / IAM 13836 / NRRL 3357 / JCM 12722 / SRRC 167) TaxID=332952 RepID=A0A7U2QYN1_ASPFN|nr:Zn(II)2Cys6 transcription factor [Aspergillus flavus]
MDDQDNAASSKRSKKACTECRQQKASHAARCDAYLNPDRPCTRCVKMKAQCIISDPFRREHKRQRLSELEQETDELRKRLKSSQSVLSQPSPIAMLTAAAELGVHFTGNAVGLDLTPQSQSPPASYAETSVPSLSLGPPLPQVECTPGERASDPTVPRTLDGVEVTGEEIDEIFQLFFHQYAQFLPVLDPLTTPNTYYAQCPFLFWAVIGVACRTYPKNPTLLTALARSITDMALLSLASTSAPWHIIQALLLFLTWPLPKDNTRPELTFPLSGSMLHIAMQNGLHIPMSSHEFTKKRIPAPSEAELVRRAELWTRCVIVYQRACSIKGHPPRSFLELEQDFGQREVDVRKLSPSLVLERKCQELVARCSAAVLEIGVRTMSLEQERALDILLRTFENQVTDLEAQLSQAHDRIQTTICRLSIQMLHFFKSQTLLSTGCIQRLLYTACLAIESIEDISRASLILATTPLELYFALLLASVALLRILKGPSLPGLDIERARSCFFVAINLLKQMSVQNNDAAAKTVIVLNQLWNSTRAFRKPDGSDFPTLRIRSRLMLSPVVDAVWWWREEHDPQCRSGAPSQGNATDGIDTHRDNTGAVVNAPIGLMGRHEPVLFDDQFLADFEWALGDDGLFPPTEPYGSGWS